MKQIYKDGKLCSKPTSPNKEGQIIIYGQSQAAVLTPFVSLIVKEIIKENFQPEVSKVSSHKEPSTRVTITGSQLDVQPSIIEDKFDKISLQKRKWSGFTFINEGLRQFNQTIYERELEKITEARRKWKIVQSKLEKKKAKELLIGAGPSWFQEPSHKQIELVTQLGDILKADNEEGIVSRTRKFLSDLGVVPNISAKDILKGMKESYLDPINFLLEMHAAVARNQKKDMESKNFSTNERLLLTAVCTLHLPLLLSTLHLILPLSNSNKDLPITSNCLDVNIQYCCPYQEPLMCRGPDWFEQQVSNQLKRSLLVLKGVPLDCDDGFIYEKQNTPIVPDKTYSTIITELIVSRYLSLIAEESVKVGSISSSLEKQSKTEMSSLNNKSSKFYVKRLSTNRIKSRTEGSGVASSLTKVEDTDENIGIHSNVPHPVLLERKDPTPGTPVDQMQIQTETAADYEVRESFKIKKDEAKNPLDVTPPERPLAMDYKNVLYAKTALNPIFKEDSCQCEYEQKYELSIQKKQKLESIGEMSKQSNTQQVKQEIVEKQNTQLIKPEINSQDFIKQNEASIIQTTTVKEENVSLDKHSISLGENINKTQHDLIQNMFDSVKAIPKNRQLQYVLELLSAAGDPLAQLPDCHKLASVKRWIELRQGVRIKLTPKDNDQLLEASRRRWSVPPSSQPIPVPKLKLSKKEERALDWNKRDWLRKKLDQEFTRYFSELKQQKINNSRVLFPTMMMQYYSNSKVNHSFRQCFYTYLPAREIDIFVYRPWQEDENKHLGDD